MREIKLSESLPKQRLLAAAEQLFAEKGFESVAVRDVTQLAKANVAAVNYHFGSRDGLVALVIARHLAPLNQERLEWLDVLERKAPGKVVPIEEIIHALIRPLVGMVGKTELSEALFCKLVGRILALPEEALSVVTMGQMKVLNNRFIRAIGKVLPTVSQDDLQWRMHFLVGSLVHLLTHQDLLRSLSNGGSGSPTLEVVLGRFVRFAAAGLREGVEVEVEANSPQALFDF
jgi:AcrR family transcriptional regulator